MVIWACDSHKTLPGRIIIFIAILLYQANFISPTLRAFIFLFFFPKSPITYFYVNQILHSTRLICMFALSHCEGFFELLICETYWIVIPVQHVLFSCTLRRQLTFFLIGFPTNGAEVVGWRRGFKKKKKRPSLFGK